MRTALRFKAQFKHTYIREYLIADLFSTLSNTVSILSKPFTKTHQSFFISAIQTDRHRLNLISVRTGTEAEITVQYLSCASCCHMCGLSWRSAKVYTSDKVSLKLQTITIQLLLKGQRSIHSFDIKSIPRNKIQHDDRKPFILIRKQWKKTWSLAH